MKPLLIVNPQSGGGATKKIFPSLRRTIEAELGEMEVVFTERAGHGIALAKAAADAGHTLVIAVGGDGTFNEVVNGVLASARKDEVEIGIIGQGTGGDFLRSVGIEHRLDRYLSVIKSGKTRQLDVGRAAFTQGDSTFGARYFVNVISAGLGGLVDRYVATSSRALGGKAAYFMASARALFASREGHLEVEVTRAGVTERHRLSTYMIAVCNGRYFGSGMMVAPMAEIDDGRFEMISVGAPSKFGFAMTSGTSIYSGAHLRKPGVVHMGCDKISMDLKNEDARSVFLVDLDGEPVGSLPLTIELVPAAVRLRA